MLEINLKEKLENARSWREAGVTIEEVLDAFTALEKRITELEKTNMKLRQSRKENK